MRKADLSPKVGSYVDNLTDQLALLVKKYNKTHPKQLEPLVLSEEMTLEDVKHFGKLSKHLLFAFEQNNIPPSELKAFEEEQRKTFSENHLIEAREVLGQENVFGPSAVENTFGTKLETKDIPPIPFSKAELERAKEQNQFLVLRIDKAPDGQPLTMKKMNEIMTPKFKKNNKGKVFFDTDRYKNEPFYTEETSTIRWSLVSKEVLPDSTDKNYVKQTEVIVAHLRNNIYKDQEVPEPYKSAITEFESKKADLTARISTDWAKVAEELESLQITILTRQTPAEAIYDTLIRFNTINTRHLPNHYAWTRSRHSDGRLVRVGDAVAVGVSVSRWNPGIGNGSLGVLFVRQFQINLVT